jgi:hypothetical protein
MTAYSDIRGYRVKYLASDPTLNTSTEGQVWYNSTEGVLKSLVQIKAWSAGGNLNTARYALGWQQWNTNSRFGFGGIQQDLIQLQQKNIQDILGSAGGNLGTARYGI